MAHVEYKNIYKSFGDTEVLHDINLDIHDGEFVVLVGPSGCGKSTTLRLLAGLEDITHGTIAIDDKVVNDVAPKNRDIAMVFQNYALYPHMNVFDNMAFGLKLRKFDQEEIDARVEEAADILGIRELLQRKPKALSGGQRQRVALGRAIVRKPEVFLFDEPLSNLDAKLRVQMRTEIKKLHSTLQTTMVYVTHDQVEAMTMGDRIVVMKDGYVHQFNSPLDVYARPNDKFVGGFIGSPSMNFLNVEVLRNDGITLNEGELRFSVPKQYESVLQGSGLNTVVLGIRPEDISLAEEIQGTPENVFRLQIDVSEPMGSELYLYFPIGDVTMVGRIKGHHDFEYQDMVDLYFDMDNAHLFHPETGERLN